MDELLRLLALIERELDANDARAELGGRPPDDDRRVWAAMGDTWRVVVTFDEPPADREAKRARLEKMLAPFSNPDRLVETPSVHPGRQSMELDEELDRLAERAGALAAVVFDERSPVVWGSSAPRADGWDVEAMELVRSLVEDATAAGLDPARWLAEEAPTAAELIEAGVDETQGRRWMHRFRRIADLAPAWERADWDIALQIAVAVGVARDECRGGRAPERVAEHGEGWGVFAKGFAQIYLLALVFDGGYSELHAEGPLVRALPHIETLVLALPPVEPPPRGAKVIAFRRG